MKTPVLSQKCQLKIQKSSKLIRCAVAVPVEREWSNTQRPSSMTNSCGQ